MQPRSTIITRPKGLAKKPTQGSQGGSGAFSPNRAAASSVGSLGEGTSIRKSVSPKSAASPASARKSVAARPRVKSEGAAAEDSDASVATKSSVGSGATAGSVSAVKKVVVVESIPEDFTGAPAPELEVHEGQEKVKVRQFQEQPVAAAGDEETLVDKEVSVAASEDFSNRVRAVSSFQVADSDSDSDESSGSGGEVRLDGAQDHPDSAGAGIIPQIGDRVAIMKGEKEVIGTCAFVGPTKFAGGTWIGLVLHFGVGKNDGSVNGVRYFETPGQRGIFVKPTAVVRILDSEERESMPSKRLSLASSRRSVVLQADMLNQVNNMKQSQSEGVIQLNCLRDHLLAAEAACVAEMEAVRVAHELDAARNAEAALAEAFAAERAEASVAELRASLAEEQKQHSALEARGQALTTERAEMEKRSLEADALTAALRDELAERSRHLEAAQRGLEEHSTKAAAAGEEAQLAQTQVRELLARQGDAAGSEEARLELQKRLAAAEQGLQDAAQLHMSALAAAKDQAAAALRDREAALRQELGDAQAQCEALRTASHQHETAVEASQAAHTALQRQLTQVGDAAGKSEERLALLEQELEAAGKAAADHSSALAAAAADRGGLESRAQGLQADCDALRDELRASEADRAAAAAAEQGQAAALADVTARHTALQQELEGREAQRAVLAAELQAAQDKLASLGSSTEDREAALERQLAAARGELADRGALEARLASEAAACSTLAAAKETQDAEVAAFRTKEGEHNKELEAAAAKIQSLEAQLAAAADGASANTGALEERAAALAAAAAREAELGRRLAEVRGLEAASQEKLVHTEEVLRKVQEDHVKQGSELSAASALRSELHEAQRQLRDAVEAQSLHADKEAGRDAREAQLASELGEAQAQQQVLSGDHAAACGARDALERKLKETVDALQEVQRALALAEETASSGASRTADLERRLRDAEDQTARSQAADAGIDMLRRELEASRQKLEVVRQEAALERDTWKSELGLASTSMQADQMRFQQAAAASELRAQQLRSTVETLEQSEQQAEADRLALVSRQELAEASAAAELRRLAEELQEEREAKEQELELLNRQVASLRAACGKALDSKAAEGSSAWSPFTFWQSKVADKKSGFWSMTCCAGRESPVKVAKPSAMGQAPPDFAPFSDGEEHQPARQGGAAAAAGVGASEWKCFVCRIRTVESHDVGICEACEEKLDAEPLKAAAAAALPGCGCGAGPVAFEGAALCKRCSLRAAGDGEAGPDSAAGGCSSARRRPKPEPAAAARGQVKLQMDDP